MRTSFHLPKTVLQKRRCCAAVVLIILTLSGCCIETKDKPGIVVRGDWALELNRSRAIEWVAYDSGDRSSGIRKKKKGHHAPCGKWGCLLCALGPNTGEEESETEEEQKPLTVTPPQYMGQYPLLPPPLSGISPFYAGPPPGLGGPLPPFMPPFVPQPVPVINPRTGQQQLMQPVMPGQPGMLMLHAQNGQPVMVNPAPLGNSEFRIPNSPILPPLAPGMLPPFAPPVPPSVLGPPGALGAPPWGMAMVNPMTGQLFPNPYPPGGDSEEQATEKNASADTPQSPMPTPRFHPVPTQPVFQRTSGIATTKEAETEQRLRQLKLEKALGMKVPEGAKIAPNGVNQQILQTTAASGGKGGGPVNGSPFSSINGILGLNENESRRNQTLGPAEMKYLQTQEQQILVQKTQIAELQQALRKSRRNDVVVDSSDSRLWTQLFDSSEFPVSQHEVVVGDILIGDVPFEEEYLEEESDFVQERSRPAPLKNIPNPPPLKTSRSSSLSPLSWFAPSGDAERAAQYARKAAMQAAVQKKSRENILPKISSNLTPPWLASKPAARVPSREHFRTENPLIRRESEINPIQQVSQVRTEVSSQDSVSTEMLTEEEYEEEAEEILSQPEEIVQLPFQEERQPIRLNGNGPRKDAPIPNWSRTGNAPPNIPPVYCVPKTTVPQLGVYGKR